MEMIGQTRESLAAYTCAQVANLVPDGRGDALLPVVSRHIDEALARTGRCIDAVRMWRPGQFNYLHSSQYCQYLYYLANTIWRNERNGEACTKLFLLNKALNAIDLFYEIEMPEVFLLATRWASCWPRPPTATTWCCTRTPPSARTMASRRSSATAW
ncbi:hypothetical protein [Cupriavidus sp. EM10]|uniref:hypothetical protein n=1 Tax=Cupriavidus sp. EM10 TaxID=2839983 RepID=UPI001CECEBE3|nr:hypothetical protein [Cupriavidus sp. EM10]